MIRSQNRYALMKRKTANAVNMYNWGADYATFHIAQIWFLSCKDVRKEVTAGFVMEPSSEQLDR